eukprot:TRINITY_DN9262_c0_g1_i1.p1 TRINITY_DN9262_c0_g1~~TRINITY_DN9262_c0_g1_i1.p1  ORF type:complete len:570 (+),score=159.91 TRINITY_DN9262_c0_g1_i1:45-1754(+)
MPYRPKTTEDHLSLLKEVSSKPPTREKESIVVKKIQKVRRSSNIKDAKRAWIKEFIRLKQEEIENASQLEQIMTEYGSKYQGLIEQYELYNDATYQMKDQVIQMLFNVDTLKMTVDANVPRKEIENGLLKCEETSYNLELENRKLQFDLENLQNDLFAINSSRLQYKLLEYESVNNAQFYYEQLHKENLPKYNRLLIEDKCCVNDIILDMNNKLMKYTDETNEELSNYFESLDFLKDIKLADSEHENIFNIVFVKLNKKTTVTPEKVWKEYVANCINMAPLEKNYIISRYNVEISKRNVNSNIKSLKMNYQNNLQKVMNDTKFKLIAAIHSNSRIRKTNNIKNQILELASSSKDRLNDERQIFENIEKSINDLYEVDAHYIYSLNLVIERIKKAIERIVKTFSDLYKEDKEMEALRQRRELKKQENENKRQKQNELKIAAKKVESRRNIDKQKEIKRKEKVDLEIMGMNRKKIQLDNFYKKVEPKIERDKNRVIKDTKAIEDRRKQKENQLKLWKVYGYDEKNLLKDSKYRLMVKLSDAGLLHSQFASAAFKELSNPRKDTISESFFDK